METIGSQALWSLLSNSERAEAVSCGKIRKDPGHRVGSYLELATKVAELHFRNRDHVLLYRGQSQDYPNTKGYTSLKPRLFRPKKNSSRLPTDEDLDVRFDTLFEA